MILVLEVLDPDSLHEIDIMLSSLLDYTANNKIETLELSVLRCSNPIRINFFYRSLIMPELIYVTKSVFYTIRKNHWSELFSNFFVNYSYPKSSTSLPFFTKYRFYFRKKMDKYKVGLKYYESDLFVDKIALQYAYLLYLVIQKDDLYFFVELLIYFSFYD
nr:hypothetical protein [Porphyropsis coccinea]